MELPVGTAALVLLAVLVVGVLAGLSKRRWGLLLVGVVAIVAVGFVVTAVGGGTGTRAADLTRLYSTTVPPLVTFVVGWVCARGSWFTRVVVVAVAALLLAALPYAALGEATATVLAR